MQSGAEYGIIWRETLELLRFRLLRHMGRIGIKPNVLGKTLVVMDCLEMTNEWKKATIVGRETTGIVALIYLYHNG